MGQLQIKGIEFGQGLAGRLDVSGSKNAALPILAASLLSKETLVLTNVPYLTDVMKMLELLGTLGASVVLSDKASLEISTHHVTSCQAPYDLVKVMRASFLVLGPLLARYGQASVSLPGGCAIGTRPIFEHLKGLEQLGANVSMENGYVEARVPQSGLKGNQVVLEKISVTGTENILMAAVLADGETEIVNAAREPEVVDLAKCLVAMGAKIEGAGTDKILVQGVVSLHGCSHKIIPDRIEAGTFLIAAVMSRGSIRLNNVCPDHLTLVLEKLREAGAEINVESDSIHLDMHQNRPKAVSVRTSVYPGFPTDLQAQWAAMNAVAEGASTVCETIFDNRFMHLAELQRMGADISLTGNTLFIKGKERLQGANVMATDLRASACLVLAAMMAQGTSIIDRVYHIDRGYECIEDKFSNLGLDIRRFPIKEHGWVHDKTVDEQISRSH